MARPISRPRPLGSRRHRLKVRRDEKLSCSASGLSVDVMPSAVVDSVEAIRGGILPESSVPAPDASGRCDDIKSKSPSSSVLVLPSAGKKLGHMLSLINQEDVEFMQHPLFTEIHFSSDGDSRAMHPLRARRLRGLLALAHHLDEEDRFLEVPPAADDFSS